MTVHDPNRLTNHHMHLIAANQHVHLVAAGPLPACSALPPNTARAAPPQPPQFHPHMPQAKRGKKGGSESAKSQLGDGETWIGVNRGQRCEFKACVQVRPPPSNSNYVPGRPGTSARRTTPNCMYSSINDHSEPHHFLSCRALP